MKQKIKIQEIEGKVVLYNGRQAMGVHITRQLPQLITDLIPLLQIHEQRKIMADLHSKLCTATYGKESDVEVTGDEIAKFNSTSPAMVQSQSGAREDRFTSTSVIRRIRVQWKPKLDGNYILLEPWMLEHGLVKMEGDETDYTEDDPLRLRVNWTAAFTKSQFEFNGEFAMQYRRPITQWNSSEIGKKFPVKG